MESPGSKRALSQAAVSGNGATSDPSETNSSNSYSSQDQSTSITEQFHTKKESIMEQRKDTVEMYR